MRMRFWIASQSMNGCNWCFIFVLVSPIIYLTHSFYYSCIALMVGPKFFMVFIMLTSVDNKILSNSKPFSIFFSLLNKKIRLNF